MKKILDTIFRFSVSLNETKRNETKRNETKRNETKRTILCSKIGRRCSYLVCNCTSIRRKESEGLNLCSLFIRGAFLC